MMHTYTMRPNLRQEWFYQAKSGLIGVLPTAARISTGAGTEIKAPFR